METTGCCSPRSQPLRPVPYLTSASLTLALPTPTPTPRVGVGNRADPPKSNPKSWDFGQVGNHPPDVREGAGRNGREKPEGPWVPSRAGSRGGRRKMTGCCRGSGEGRSRWGSSPLPSQQLLTPPSPLASLSLASP